MLIGYSLGARIALHAAAHHPEAATAGVAAVGGSGGLKDPETRRSRAARDDALAEALRDGGIAPFANAWYRQGLFKTLAVHPRWGHGAVVSRRVSAADESDDSDVANDDEDNEIGGVGGECAGAYELAEALSALSPGRQPPVTGADLAAIAGRGPAGLMLLAGSEDAKFVAGAQAMARARRRRRRRGGEEPEVVIVRVPDTLCTSGSGLSCCRCFAVQRAGRRA